MNNISLFHAHPRPRSPVSTVWSSAAKNCRNPHFQVAVVSEVQLGSAYCKLVHLCEIKITTKYFDEFLLSSVRGVSIMACIREGWITFFLREACLYQYRWIFGKVPNGLWPPCPLFFGKNVAIFFYENFWNGNEPPQIVVSNAKNFAPKFSKNSSLSPFQRISCHQNNFCHYLHPCVNRWYPVTRIQYLRY